MGGRRSSRTARSSTSTERAGSSAKTPRGPPEAAQARRFTAVRRRSRRATSRRSSGRSMRLAPHAPRRSLADQRLGPFCFESDVDAGRVEAIGNPHSDRKQKGWTHAESTLSSKHEGSNPSYEELELDAGRVGPMPDRSQDRRRVAGPSGGRSSDRARLVQALPADSGFDRPPSDPEISGAS
jgi:hypothetical protein